MFYSNFKRLNDLSNAIDSHFHEMDKALDWNLNSKASSYVVNEIDAGYEIIVSLPGHTKESITANIEDSSLLIRASIEETKPLVSNQSFKFSLPKDSDFSTDSIEATVENGILTVVIPKAKKVSSNIKIK